MTTVAWRPTASINNLRLRAGILHKIRTFFLERGVLEVETPLLAKHGVTNPHINNFTADFIRQGLPNETYYLQTSPEYAMKRLLAADIVAIYQICKSFRNGDLSELHNPEFTMLEWYRPGFDLNDLIQELDELLQLTLNSKPVQIISYSELFQTHLAIDPLTCSVEDLKQLAQQHEIHLAQEYELDKDTWLQLLMGHLIEGKLGFDAPICVTQFPASQAALARLDNNDPRVAARVELYIHGMEIANGFYELTDAKEQRIRFEQDQSIRKKLNYPDVTLDERLLAAISAGLPDCSGIALGIDRLLMVACNTNKIADIISFTWPHA
jgi:elongation factor P--(R)-beta-lysine ligase